VIDEQRPHSVIVEASLVLVIVPVGLEGASVIAIEPAQPRTKPHESLVVLGNRPDISVRESVGNGQMAEAKTGRRRRSGKKLLVIAARLTCLIFANFGNDDTLSLEPILFQTTYDASGYSKGRNQNSGLGSSIQSHTPDADMIFKIH
jgi:hypothetical protein